VFALTLSSKCWERERRYGCFWHPAPQAGFAGMGDEDGRRVRLDGVERGEEEIFPDPMSQLLADGWRAGVAKELERQNAALVAAEPIAA
jgi:hypothetical protein